MKQEQANFSLQTLLLVMSKAETFFLEHIGEKQTLVSLPYIILVHTRQIQR